MENYQRNHRVFMPNEIFMDLEKKLDIGTQRAFAYSYYYYITYLYRYCKWIDDEGEKVTQSIIKERLGYSPSNKKINFIIKKNGTLDHLGYTETTTEYPIEYAFEDEEIIIFITNKDLKGSIPKHNFRNFKIKKPIRAFSRDLESYNEDFLNGTFYEIDNTHEIRMHRFNYIIDKLGTTAFYIYGYMNSKKHRLDDLPYIKISEELGLSERTVMKYMHLLEEHNLIRIERGDLYTNDDEEVRRESNHYKIIA